MITDDTCTVALVGDASDPLFDAIAAALPANSPCYANLEGLAAAIDLESPALPRVVLHRPYPCAKELRVAVELWRASEKRLGLILCTSLTARYRQLEPWLALCEAILPEATASETIGRHVCSFGSSSAPGFRVAAFAAHRRRVAVVSTDFELRVMLSDVCQRAGYVPRPARTWNDARAASLAVWDVPVFDESWLAQMRREGRRRRILALAGFCERSLVAELKRNGARACLDLPCNVDDFAWVLNSLASVDVPSILAHASHGAAPSPHILAQDDIQRPAARGHRGLASLE